MPTSKKLYEEVAKTVKAELELGNWAGPEKQAIAKIVRQIARDFKEDNIKFKLDRFFLACGMDEKGYPYVANWFGARYNLPKNDPGDHVGPSH